MIYQPLDDDLWSQLKIRQDKTSERERSPETLNWLNSNGTFVRLKSSVDIVETPFPNQYSQYPLGDELARRSTLFGGLNNGQVGDTVSVYKNPIRQGIQSEPFGSSATGGAYAPGPLGIKPMPGITDVNIKTVGDKFLREASISIKAYDKDQFDVIDTLYLRPGMTVLLEWGHTSYFNNDGILNTNILDEIPLSDTQEIMYERINTIREDSNYNYDALFGFITNFNWSVNTDGSYNITLTVISTSDIVDSLRINVSDPKSTPQNSSNDKKQSTLLSKILQPLVTLSTEYDLTDEYLTILGIPVNIGKVLDTNFFEDRNRTIKANFNYLKDYLPSGSSDDYTEVLLYDFSKDGERDSYIKLGTLIALLEENFVIQDQNSSSIIKLDYNLDNTIVFSHPLQVSTNPKVCIIPVKDPIKTKISNVDPTRVTTWKYKITNRIKNYLQEVFSDSPVKSEDNDFKLDLLDQADQRYKVEDSNYKTRLLRTFVSVNHIINKIENLKDKNGEILLKPFILSILSDINEATGYLNPELRLTLNEENQTLQIRSFKTSVDEKDYEGPWIERKISTFGIGDENGGSSTLKNISLNSNLTNEIASTIAIGAQASGKSLSADTNMLTHLNYGLKDRIISERKTKIDKDSSYATTDYEEDKEDTYNLLDLYTFLLKIYSSNNIKFNSSLTDENISKATNFLKYRLAEEIDSNPVTYAKTTPIPVELSFELDGISGFKLYNKFVIDSTLLPSQYLSDTEPIVYFIINDISHTIKINKWVTKITALMAPLPLYTPNPFNIVGEGSPTPIINPDYIGDKPTSIAGEGQTPPPAPLPEDLDAFPEIALTPDQETVGNTGLTQDEINRKLLTNVKKRINGHTPYDFAYTIHNATTQQGGAINEEFFRGNTSNVSTIRYYVNELETKFYSEWQYPFNIDDFKGVGPDVLGVTPTYDSWINLLKKYFPEI